MDQVPEIDVQEAQHRLEEGALLVDVREADEYRQARIPGSLLLPLSEFQARYAELPQDRPLILQCRSGVRSARATEFLLGRGYRDVANLAGGILAWKSAELPVEAD